MNDVVQFFAAILKWAENVKHSRAIMLFSVITGIIAGLGSTALLPLINAAITGSEPIGALAWKFAVLCLVIPASGFVSQISLMRLATEAEYSLRLKLTRQILAMPYRRVEELRSHRLMAALVEDIPAVTSAISNLPLLFMHSAILTACLAYLGWLSWRLLLMLLLFIIIGFLPYQSLVNKSLRSLRLMRQQSDSMFQGARALTEGIKELKLNRDRRRGFLEEEFEPTLARLRHYWFQGQLISRVSDNWGWIQFFVFIGLAVFVAPHIISISHKDLTGYSLTVLFLMAPLSNILLVMPSFERAYIAAEKTQSLGLSLTSQPSDLDEAATGNQHSWRQLDLKGVSHAYELEGKTGEFYLGPIDLTFRPGELVFLIGGNGSGKTTLAKLLMGLYEPEKGEIYLDGTLVTRENRDDYRQHFSVVFSDFFLFDRLLGLNDNELKSKGQEYLAQLQLDHKVRIEKDRLSTIDLSQGQRKRVALWLAYLENRPIYLFDEWAADQDPMFKRIFYLEILSELKARGKMVIVISHDDHYYHVADRIIKLDQGQIEYDKPATDSPSPTLASA